jgi:hypothetical protein
MILEDDDIKTKTRGVIFFGRDNDNLL